MSDKTTHYDTESALRATAEKLQGVLESMETGTDGSHPAIVADIARISTALTTTCAELRQHAKARVREVSQIPLDQVIAYLKTLPKETKADICQNLSGVDDEMGLL